MAHAAQLDDDNTVIQVIVISNDIENPEQFATDLFGGNWKQTSYNGTIRKNFAGIGFTYDENRDAFVPPEPEGNIGFDEEICRWIMPEITRE